MINYCLHRGGANQNAVARFPIKNKDSMNWSFEWLLGWRYTSVSRGAHKNRFISFISVLSMMSIVLGVAALIISLNTRQEERVF